MSLNHAPQRTAAGRFAVYIHGWLWLSFRWLDRSAQIMHSPPDDIAKKTARMGRFSLFASCVAVFVFVAFPNTASWFGKSGESAIGHAIVGLIIATNICLIGATFAVVGLFRRESPRSPAIIGLVLNILPALAAINMDIAGGFAVFLCVAVGVAWFAYRLALWSRAEQRRRVIRQPRLCCVRCAASLTASVGVCPECGWTQP